MPTPNQDRSRSPSNRKDSYYSNDDSYTDYSDESFYSDDESAKGKSKGATQKSSSTVRRSNTKTLKKGPGGRTSKASKAGGGGNMTPRSNDYVTKRMLSARRIKINELKNEIDDLSQQLDEVRTENRLIRRQKNIQERQLDRYEGQEGDMPMVLQRHSEEVRALREQLKRAKEKTTQTERKLRDTSEELSRTQYRLKKARAVIDEKNLGERDQLSRKLHKTEHARDTKEKRISELERHIENLQKNHRHELGIERARQRESQRQVQEMQGTVDRLQGNLREKEKEIEVRNIYANRMKPPHRLSSTRSTPAPLMLSSRDRKRSEPLALSPAEKVLMEENQRNADQKRKERKQKKRKFKSADKCELSGGKSFSTTRSPARKGKKESMRFPPRSSARQISQPQSAESGIVSLPDRDRPQMDEEHTAAVAVPAEVARRPPPVDPIHPATDTFVAPPYEAAFKRSSEISSHRTTQQSYQPSFLSSSKPNFATSGPKQTNRAEPAEKHSESHSSFFLTESEDPPSWLHSNTSASNVKRKQSQIGSIEYKPSLGHPTRGESDYKPGVFDDLEAPSNKPKLGRRASGSNINKAIEEDRRDEELAEHLRQQQLEHDRQQQDLDAQRRQEEELYERQRRAREEEERQHEEEEAMEEERREREHKLREERERREEEERLEKERIDREEREREERERREREEEARQLANSEAEKERLRQKELLLAKMKAIDDGQQISPQDSPSRQRRNYTFTKPVENLHNGKASQKVAVPVIERRRKSLLDDEELSFGSYAPTLTSNRRESMHKRNDDVDIKPKNAAAAKKSNLMADLFGSPASPKPDPAEQRQGSASMLPRRGRQPSPILSSKPAVNAIDDFEEDIEEVML